jgi:hypothetical protein
MGSVDWPRKVTVYGCKWPGDDEHERSMKYFRKYVKVSPYAPLCRSSITIGIPLAHIRCGRCGL